MSMHADLAKTFREVPSKYGISKEQAAKLLIDVLESVEWDLEDFVCSKEELPYNMQDDIQIVKDYLWAGE